MATSKTPNLIDGLSSVRAVQRAERRTTARPATGKAKGKQKAKAAAPRPKSARIGHTAVPSKHHIICYSCAYEFTFQGRLRDTACPKCREALEFKNLVIEGTCSDSIRTIGNVELLETGRFEGAQVVARRVILAGNAEDSDIRACEGLELRAGAKFNLDRITTDRIVIAEKSRFMLESRFPCKNLEIRGELAAKVFAEGMVTVKPGGFLRGEFNGSHLVIEDGGGLTAKVKVTPPPDSTIDK